MKRFFVVLSLLASPALAQMGPVPGSGSGTSTLTAATTATSGCTDGGFLYSLTSLLRCGAVMTTDGNTVTIDNQASGANILVLKANGSAVITVGGTGSATLGTNVSITNANLGGFRPSATPTLSADNGNQLTLGNGTTTVASVPAPTLALTASTMTASITAQYRTVTHAYAWTNAMVTALGASLTGDINVATLPAKTQINNAYVVIDTAAGGVTTLTVSCGDAIGGTPFTNYIVASDAKAAANTVYGDAVAERGTSIDTEFYYLPSYTATTLVTCHFISTGTNLNTVTTSTGRLILTTTLLP